MCGCLDVKVAMVQASYVWDPNWCTRKYFSDDEVVYKNTLLTYYTLKNKRHSIDYYLCREVVFFDILQVAKEGNKAILDKKITKILMKVFLGYFTYL